MNDPPSIEFDGEQTKGLIHPKPYHSNSVKLCARVSIVHLKPCALYSLRPLKIKTLTPESTQARIVMMPCILRRQNMEGDLPWLLSALRNPNGVGALGRHEAVSSHARIAEAITR